MCLALAATLTVALAASGSASGSDTITSSGPLTSIQTTADLNCDVDHAGDDHGEFFGETACGTLVAFDGTLFGPATIPAGSSASPRFPWEPVSQLSSGSGSPTDPYRIVTVVHGGGISLTQTDTYVVGSESYGTRVAISNTTGAPLQITLYRVGDCYLEDNDWGYGAVDTTAGTASCLASLDPGSRIEQWAPVTPGSHRIEAFFNDLWAAVGTQQPLPDTCACAEFHDNAAGLSWTATIPAGGTSSFSHLTGFSPTGNVQVADSDGDGFPDAWESPTGGVDTNADGTPDLKLSDFGATPDRRDVFVQVNWARTRCALIFFCSTANRRPSLGALRDIQRAFATHGVRLHVDAGPDSIMNPDTDARWGGLSRVGDAIETPQRIPGMHGDDFNWSEAFDGYRNQLVPAERARIFHFVFYVGSFDGGHSGLARSGAGGPFAGRDVMIAHDDFTPTRIREAGTVMHELGHNLGLSHGGSVEEQAVNYKPNYPSVMNYAWQFSGTFKSSTLGLLDYSEGTLAPINELALSEPGGLEPDAAAGDIGTKWSCPGTRAYRGPLPSVFNVDWNCNGHIDAGTVGTNVNDPATPGNASDPSLTELHDHDDWGSLLFDGGGALGGAGDTASPAAATPVAEPTTQQLTSAAGDLHTVSFTAPGHIAMQANSSAPVPVRIANHHAQRRVYTLAVIADGVALSGLPRQVTLAPRQARTLKPLVKAGAANATAFFEIDATSNQPTDADSAISDVEIVDGPVRGQPRVSTIVALDDSGKPLRIAIDGARAQRVRGHHAGPVLPVTAGPHTIRISTGTGRRTRRATVQTTLQAHQLAAFVISTRRGAPRVHRLTVAPRARGVLSLLPGSHRVRVGSHGRSVPHGRLIKLPRRARTIAIGTRNVRLGHVQLVVLTPNGRGGVSVTTLRRR